MGDCVPSKYVRITTLECLVDIKRVIKEQVIQFPKARMMPKVPKTNLEKNPISPYDLSLGHTVAHEQHYGKNPTDKFLYGEVVHHNKLYATVRWDDGHTTVHSRSTGIEKGANEGFVGRGTYQIAQGTRLAKKVPSRDLHQYAHEQTWKRIQANAQAVAHHLKQHGLDSTIDYDNDSATSDVTTIDVHTHDHRLVHNALMSVTTAHSERTFGSRGTEDEHVHNVKLPQLEAPLRVVYRTNDLRPGEHQHQFDPVQLKAFHDAIGIKHNLGNQSKVPGWRFGKVRLWVGKSYD